MNNDDDIKAFFELWLGKWYLAYSENKTNSAVLSPVNTVKPVIWSPFKNGNDIKDFFKGYSDSGHIVYVYSDYDDYETKYTIYGTNMKGFSAGEEHAGDFFKLVDSDLLGLERFEYKNLLVVGFVEESMIDGVIDKLKSKNMSYYLVSNNGIHKYCNN